MLVKMECRRGGALHVTASRTKHLPDPGGHRAPRGAKQEQKDGAWDGKVHLPVRA